MTVISTNISGIIPKKPSADALISVGSRWELSFIADGPNTIKIPMRQISIKRMYGIILKIMEGMLKKYFWSILGPQA